MDDRPKNEVEELTVRLAALGERVTENIKLLAVQVQGELSRSVADTADRIEQSAERLSNQVVSTVGKVRSNVEETVEKVKREVNVVESVRRHPAKAFLVALGAGFVIAFIGSRRAEQPLMRSSRVRHDRSAVRASGSNKKGAIASLMVPLLWDFGRAASRGYLEHVIDAKRILRN